MRTCLLPVIASVAAGCGSNNAPPAEAGPMDGSPQFSFFVTSVGGRNGGDFRVTPTDTDGLAGADAFCQERATAGVPASASRQWRAYLSTSTVNAKDRIGTGPWFNHDGVMIAASVAALLDPATNMISKTTGLTETGATVPGFGEMPNQHDILTGSTADGVSSGDHCNNWTSSDATAYKAQVGHFDRMGGGTSPMSWSSAHLSRGCAADSFPPTGGRGSIYCFAAD
jgi:hypothetical protein